MEISTAAERIADIKEHPELHQHDFGELTACCLINGALNLSVMEAHQGLYTSRGRGKCDLGKGPCACGAWHE